MVGSVQKRLEICRYVRNMAAQSCLRTFQYALHASKKVSEVQFRNRWFKELTRIRNINASGWYDPPEAGFGILFGSEKDFERVNYSNLRQKEVWPRINTYFDKKGTGYIFASPYALVDEIPIIGDFGFTYYLGNNDVIKNHFRKCHKLLYQLIDEISVGTSFQKLYIHALTELQSNGLKNNIISATDSTGTDLGHTVPFISDNPSDKMKNALLKADKDKIHTLISKARKFINSKENYLISTNCAFTFEPRFVFMDGTKFPMVSFNTIVQFIKGKKVVLSNFDGLINLLDMQWIYS